jgi:hypothetical protein
MWRERPDPLVLPQGTTSAHVEPGPPRRPSRSVLRRRRQVADGLRNAAQRAAPGARRRPYEVLLLRRAAAVRRELLEISALVRISSGPDPGCLAELHALLTSGTDSPLFNSAASAEQLVATLERARRELTTSAYPAQAIQKSELLGDVGLRGSLPPRG